MSIVRCGICEGIVDLDFNSEDMIDFKDMGLVHIECLVDSEFISNEDLKLLLED
ncbi:MAG: hypothetical protein ACRCX2_10075 [Paraclostridium sp.]